MNHVGRNFGFCIGEKLTYVHNTLCQNVAEGKNHGQHTIPPEPLSGFLQARILYLMNKAYEAALRSKNRLQTRLVGENMALTVWLHYENAAQLGPTHLNIGP